MSEVIEFILGVAFFFVLFRIVRIIRDRRGRDGQ